MPTRTAPVQLGPEQWTLTSRKLVDPLPGQAQFMGLTMNVLSSELGRVQRFFFETLKAELEHQKTVAAYASSQTGTPNREPGTPVTPPDGPSRSLRAAGDSSVQAGNANISTPISSTPSMHSLDVSLHHPHTQTSLATSLGAYLHPSALDGARWQDAFLIKRDLAKLQELEIDVESVYDQLLRMVNAARQQSDPTFNLAERPLASMPKDVPSLCQADVVEYDIPPADPRIFLSGQKGLRAGPRGLKKGTILGTCRCIMLYEPEFEHLQKTTPLGYKMNKPWGAFLAGHVLHSLPGIQSGTEFIPVPVYYLATGHGNLTALVHDVGILTSPAAQDMDDVRFWSLHSGRLPTSSKGRALNTELTVIDEDYHLVDNCTLIIVKVRGWPVPVLITSQDVPPDEPLNRVFPEEYWRRLNKANRAERSAGRRLMDWLRCFRFQGQRRRQQQQEQGQGQGAFSRPSQTL